VACNPSTKEAEAGGLLLPDKSGYIVFQKKLKIRTVCVAQVVECLLASAGPRVQILVPPKK
jgi:hypothetical protein